MVNKTERLGTLTKKLPHFASSFRSGAAQAARCVDASPDGLRRSATKWGSYFVSVPSRRALTQSFLPIFFQLLPRLLVVRHCLLDTLSVTSVLAVT
jgi:hypothetical protein